MLLITSHVINFVMLHRQLVFNFYAATYNSESSVKGKLIILK